MINNIQWKLPLDRHQKPLEYFEQALTIKQALHKREEDHADVAVALSDVADASSVVEPYKKPLAPLAIAYWNLRS